jgi:hypothetical protein
VWCILRSHLMSHNILITAYTLAYDLEAARILLLSIIVYINTGYNMVFLLEPTQYQS